MATYHDPSLAEDRLTDALCGYLEATTPTELSLLRFTFQQPLDGRRSADMGVRPRPWQGITIDQRNVSIDDPVAVIEAKRLPTPGTNRTWEYVIDDRLDDNPPTNAKAKWSPADELVWASRSARVEYYPSTQERAGGGPIRLHHVWVRLIPCVPRP